MATNRYGFVYPLSDAQVDVPNDTLALVDSIGSHSIDRFTNAGQRDSFITQPVEGQVAWLDDINILTFYTGTQWLEHKGKGVNLPATVESYGDGQNVISAASADVLPSFTANAVITNPHPSRSMRCQIIYSCWIASNGAVVQAGVTSTGAFTLTIPPPSAGWGRTIYVGNIGSVAIQRMGTIVVELPSGTTTFQWKAWRNSGSPLVSYPVTTVIPQCYL